MKKTLFIYNSKSGKGISQHKIYYIIRQLCNKYPSIIICPTFEYGDAYNFTTRYIASVDKIIVMGGDGTINDVVSAIAKSNYSPTLAIIPNGTMNDLAHNLHLPTRYRSALNIAMSDNSAYVPILKVNDTYATYGIAVGRFANTSYTTKQSVKKHFGKISYFFNAIKELFGYKSINANILIEDQIIEDNFSLLLLSTSNIIAGFQFTCNNSKTSAIFIKEPKRLKNITSFLRIAKLFVFDKKYINNDKQLGVYDFNSIQINFNAKQEIIIDGNKYIADKLDISVLQDRIRICSQ